MNSYVIHELTDEKVKVEFKGHDGSRRKITLHVEDTIYVQPDNPNKLKHRGRQAVIKGFRKDELGNVIQAKVQFLDTKRPGRVDLMDIVLQKTPDPEVRIEQNDSSKPRYLPEDVPDSLFTKSELSQMGLVHLKDEVAYVSYPEQRREYKLYFIDHVRVQKKQKSSLILNVVDTIEEVLNRRKNAIKVRGEQLKMHKLNSF